MELIFAALFVIVLIFILRYVIRSGNRRAQEVWRRERELWHRDEALIQTVTKLNRGTESERDLVLKLLRHGIPAVTIFHDLYVQTGRNHYAQIDTVVPTKVGILVFEVKEYSGWLFGRGNQPYWTQVLAYGDEKHRFYNPVFQNNGHINVLKKQLCRYAHVPFYSIIVFYGNCDLRDVDAIPDGTYVVYSHQVRALIDYLLTTKPRATYADKRGVVDTLKAAVVNGNSLEVVQSHAERVRRVSVERWSR